MIFVLFIRWFSDLLCWFGIVKLEHNIHPALKEFSFFFNLNNFIMKKEFSFEILLSLKYEVIKPTTYSLSFLLFKESVKLYETFKRIYLKRTTPKAFKHVCLMKHVCFNHRWVNFFLWMSSFSVSFDEAEKDISE